MIRWLLQFLYGSIPVRFVSPHSTDEAIARLSKAVTPWAFNPLLGQCAVGTVSRKKVRIQRVIPFAGNAWKPFFYGKFTTGEAGAVLEGAFKFSTFTRIFMSVWFGFIVLWTVLATASILHSSSAPLWFPLAGVGMFVVGLAMVRVGKWFARNDVAWLTQLIAKELAAIGHPSAD